MSKTEIVIARIRTERNYLATQIRQTRKAIRTPAIAQAGGFGLDKRLDGYRLEALALPRLTPPSLILAAEDCEAIAANLDPRDEDSAWQEAKRRRDLLEHAADLRAAAAVLA